MGKNLLTIVSCTAAGEIKGAKKLMHYIYNGRGLSIPLRQHLLREINKLESGEISYIRIYKET